LLEACTPLKFRAGAEEDEDDACGEDAPLETDELEDGTRLRESSVKDHGDQGIFTPVLVGLMLREFTVMVSPTGLTAVMTASM
jgi:hypothetical protein